MRQQRRLRLFAELTLAATSALCLTLTVMAPDWIELVFGLDPDRHSGTLEAAIAAALLAVTAALGLLARLEWHRSARASDT